MYRTRPGTDLNPPQTTAPAPANPVREIRDIPHREVVDHRVPDGLDQDHPGQPNAPA